MNNYSAYVALVNGILLVAMALIMKTKNMQSSLLFKVLPFIMGCASLFSSLLLFGVTVVKG